MLASDRLALQDLLLSVFAKADWYRLNTCYAQALVDDILHNARTILADACHLRNQLKATCRLLPELLASCFAFLPLEGRILASHVSRTWRAVALETPSLWNDITCYSRENENSSTLVKMALSRSGGLPIQLDYRRWLDDDTADLLQTYLHRITSLKLYSYPTLSFLNHPAPRLRTLVLMDDAPLSNEFLGRIPGQLVTLHSDLLVLPSSCPSLSTLKTLSASLFSDATLRSVFAMCPCLQDLSLWYLTQENVSALGRPPESLSDLSLATNSRDCNLIAVYEEYEDSRTLQNISLHCNMVGRALDFGHALHAAVDLGVKLLGGVDISITALFIGGRRLTISWPLDDEYAVAEGRAYPPFFAQAARCFDQLRTVSLPAAVLPVFILDAPPLPALEELRVEITPGKDHLGQPRVLEWSELASLQEFAASRSDFRLVLDVSHPYGPTADDARSLLRCLSDCATHLAVSVTGFMVDAIQDELPRELVVNFVPDS